ncbi:protein CLN8-like [Sycon ciliatum]|uniref:protein CLN8-like n=1 Tax=Sycon ciliatum TaxID=27933 RepID=UPI0020A9693E|eukprot:scpid62436/ scgid10469/ Protein CLN8
MDWLRKLCIGDRDLEDSTNQWTTVLFSFVFFLCVYLACLVLSLLFETYRRLSNREKVFWHLSIVRAVFGVFGAYGGIHTILGEPELHTDIVNAKTQESYFMVMVTTGFFLFECTTLFASNIYFRFIDWNLALHHSLSLIGFLMSVYYAKAHFFACAGLLLEMTTPFSAVCWLLIKAKKADTTLWRVNQHILIHLFHCRTTVELYIWWATYWNLPTVLSDMPLPLGALLYSELALINFYLTPFWTYKKTWQLFNPVDWNHADAKKTK